MILPNYTVPSSISLYSAFSFLSTIVSCVGHFYAEGKQPFFLPEIINTNHCIGRKRITEFRETETARASVFPILPQVYPATKPFFRLKLDAGVNYIDTGENYSNGLSERMIGRTIHGMTWWENEKNLMSETPVGCP